MKNWHLMIIVGLLQAHLFSIPFGTGWMLLPLAIQVGLYLLLRRMKPQETADFMNSETMLKAHFRFTVEMTFQSLFPWVIFTTMYITLLVWRLQGDLYNSGLGVSIVTIPFTVFNVYGYTQTVKRLLEIGYKDK